MKKLFLILFLLTGCTVSSAIKTLQAQQTIVSTADTAVSAWVYKKNRACIDAAHKEVDVQKAISDYVLCAEPVFDLADKIADTIDLLRAAHKVEAQTILEVVRGEKPKSVLKNITPASTKLLTDLTKMITDLK